MSSARPDLRAVALCLALTVAFLSCRLALWSGGSAHAADVTPVLRLVYMANSGGAALPCPS